MIKRLYRLPRKSLVTIFKAFFRHLIDYGDIICDRPWHDACALACTCPITCAGDEKPTNIKLHELILSKQNSQQLLYNIINFKLILLTLLFNSLFFQANLHCSYFLLPDIFSIVTQWGFCKCFIKKDKDRYLW